MNKKYMPLKRLLDIIFSVMGIFFCLAIFWWWILLINLFVTKGHPFFKQDRLGKHKKVFKILKFRSMKNDANENLPPLGLTHEEQTSMETKFGHFLRRSQLDETLQLFNILIGQMSFVGPRPGAATNEEELVIEREKYTPSAYDIKPGLTGLSQVTLKDRHNPKLKAKTDHEYVVKFNLWLDIKLFALTVFKVFNKGGSKF